MIRITVARYIRPTRLDAVFNASASLLMRIGVSLKGSRTLAVRGRSSGEWRTTPVNLLEFKGERYLVAPRGETQWVRNLRVAGEGELRLGRNIERFRGAEIPVEDRPPILRQYLRQWSWEVGQFFDGVGASAAEADLQRIAADHPVFRIEKAGSS